MSALLYVVAHADMFIMKLLVTTKLINYNVTIFRVGRKCNAGMVAQVNKLVLSAAAK